MKRKMSEIELMKLCKIHGKIMRNRSYQIQIALFKMLVIQKEIKFLIKT